MATTDRIRFRQRHTIGRRDLLVLIALAALVLLAPALVRAQSADTLNLWWTAPGDDGYAGYASRYDVRYSTSPITPLNFGTATPVPGPSPVGPGQLQRLVVRGLTRGVPYWFALRTFDESNNASNISNIVAWEWPADASPPRTPSSVSASVAGDGKRVVVSWQPSSEPDFAGYRVYRGESRSGPWTIVSPPTLKATTFTDDNVPDALLDPWYQISAFDVAGNESPRSAPILVPRGALAGRTLAWKLETGYPNPAKLGMPQYLPLTLPAGATGATIEILDGAGQRVRRLDVRATGPGVTEIVWDGRNDAGSACAPGLYRAWLIAGTMRQVVRLVRVP